jgi:hypothetical protein
VNRSTFYLHYETIADLVDETLEMINQRFLSYFPQQKEDVLGEWAAGSGRTGVGYPGVIFFPTLLYPGQQKGLSGCIPQSGSMQAIYDTGKLKQHILGPVLERFGIPAAHRPYYIAYYVEGIIAIVKEGLRQDAR